MLILGIETSCDETGAAVYDTAAQKILSNALFSQIDLHKIYGGVVPEIASRSQLEKIDLIVQQALDDAHVTLNDIDTIAVTNKPGLAGSLLVGICFAKGIAWALGKKIVAVNHLEAHIFSSFLTPDNTVNKDIRFPLISLSASGGHTALHLVSDLGQYQVIGQTHDDAAGEAFDKIAKILGLGYPGGALIEKLAQQVNFEDFFSYPRTKPFKDSIAFSFSGLKTAVLYDLVKKGAYDLATGPVQEVITLTLQQRVASSLLVCIGDIFCDAVQRAIYQHPQATAVSFAGGVACNKYLRARLATLCARHSKQFFVAPPCFCTDNGGMVAFVGGYRATAGYFTDYGIDVEN